MFSFKNNITKEFILSKLSEESIFNYYIGTTIKPNKLFCSKLRLDKHPTCSFYRSKSNILYYHDFATGDNLNCFTYVMKLYNCSYQKALNIIASDFGLLNDSKIKISQVVYNYEKIESDKKTIIQVEIKDFLDYELKWWLSFGITESILNKYKIYSIKTVFLNGNVYAQSNQSNPIYGYYFGKKEGIEQWRIYFPKSNKCRFIGNVSTKTLQGYKQLPKSGNLLLITKSMKDCLSLYSFGLSAIAPNSETQEVEDNVLSDLKTRFKYIVVFYDNDQAGISNMRKIKKKHPELNYFYIPRHYGVKDVSDFYQKYGRDITMSTIKHYIKQLRNRGFKNFN